MDTMAMVAILKICKP